MKYEVFVHGPRLEAIGAHSGYRIRMSTLSAHGLDSWPISVHGLDSWPISVHVRGSESEDEVKVELPKRHLSSATEAFDFGYQFATLWIDAQDHRLP